MILDGHVNRVLEGKRLESITPDGGALRIGLENGEQFVVHLANPNGYPLEGTPYILLDNRCYPILPNGFRGVLVELVTKNGTTCTLHTDKGDYTFVWVNENREPVKGEPCLAKVDVSIELPMVMVQGLLGAVGG